MPWIKFVWAPEEENLVVEWVQELGWSKDPFEEFSSLHEVSGYSQERGKINLFIINKEKIGVIRGEKGTGKTAMLKWLEQELQSHGQVIPVYMGSDILEDAQYMIGLLAKSATGILGKLFKKHKQVTTRHDLIRYLRKRLRDQRMILLLDDIAHVSADAHTIVKQLLEERLSVQVLIVGTKKELEKSSLSKLGHVDLALSLSKLSLSGAKDMIERRIRAVGGEGLYPFSDEAFEHMYKASNGNPGALLVECRKAAVKSTINKKMEKPKAQPKKKKAAKEEELPQAPKPTKTKEKKEKLDSIRKKITTIDYVKPKKKKEKKPSVEVIEHEHGEDGEEKDLEEKEKNDRLIHELFDE